MTTYIPKLQRSIDKPGLHPKLQRYVYINLVYTPNYNVLYLPVSHLSPVRPGEHVQVKEFKPSIQVPSFKQGLLAHSSISEIARYIAMLVI